MIAIQVLDAAGVVIGIFGFQSVPSVGEEIVFQGTPALRAHVGRVVHYAGDLTDGHPSTLTQIQLK